MGIRKFIKNSIGPKKLLIYNFITYASKANSIMSELSTNVLIKNQIKRHWERIQKRLNSVDE